MPSETSAAAECRQIIALHSKSFSLASRLLPSSVRDDAVAVYAWCRRCDDAIDLAPPHDLQESLESLSAEADGIFRGDPLSEIVPRAFQEVVRRRSIPRLYVDELLAGMAMDAQGVWAPSQIEFLHYCHRVAGVVGLMMCHVLGVSDSRALVHAAHLGMGMQMTNIARDVAEDWQRGRLYLPGFLLNDCRPMANEPLSRVIADQLSPVVARLLDWAGRYYDSGRQGLKFLDDRSGWGVATAACVYQSIGNRIKRQRFDVLAGRAIVSKPRKLGMAGLQFSKTLLRAATKFSWRPSGFPPPTDILTFEQTPVLDCPQS